MFRLSQEEIIHICLRKICGDFFFSISAYENKHRYGCIFLLIKSSRIWNHSEGLWGDSACEQGSVRALAFSPHSIQWLKCQQLKITPHQKHRCLRDGSYSPWPGCIQCICLHRSQKRRTDTACCQRAIQFPLIFSLWFQEGSRRRRAVPPLQTQHRGRTLHSMWDTLLCVKRSMKPGRWKSSLFRLSTHFLYFLPREDRFQSSPSRALVPFQEQRRWDTRPGPGALSRSTGWGRSCRPSAHLLFWTWFRCHTCPRLPHL